MKVLGETSSLPLVCLSTQAVILRTLLLSHALSLCSIVVFDKEKGRKREAWTTKVRKKEEIELKRKR